MSREQVAFNACIFLKQYFFLYSECKMVCHGKCTLTVSLTCEADQQQVKNLMLNDSSALGLYNTIVQETTDEVKYNL